MLEVVFNPPESLTDQILNPLESFNNALVPATFESNVAVIARDDASQMIGGTYGRLSWGYLYVDSLWLSESARGTGLGRQLLAEIEAAALSKGYTRAYLWTTSFQALDFYRKYGYEVFGELPDRPPGHTTYFLSKQDLTVEPG